MPEWRYVGPQTEQQPTQPQWKYVGPPAAAPQQPGAPLSGLAAAPAAGIAEQVVGATGLAGDIDTMGRSAAGWMLGKAHEYIDPHLPEGWNNTFGSAQQNLQSSQSPYPNSTSQIDRLRGLGIGEQSAPSGSFYEPKNDIERYGKAAGSMLPYMINPGGGIAQAPRAVGGAIVTGMGSEAAGDVAGAIDPSYREPAKIGTSIMLGGPRALKHPTAPIPTDETFTKAKAFYTALEGTPAAKGSVTDLGQKLREVAAAAKYDPMDHPHIRRMFRKLDSYMPKEGKELGGFMNLRERKVTSQADATLGDIDRIRQKLNDAKKAGGQEAKIAYEIENKIDDVVAAMPGGEAMEAARTNYFKAKKMEFLENLKDSIKDNEGRYRVAGSELAIRDEFRRLNRKLRGTTAASRRLAGTFSKDERKLIAKLSSPGWSWQGLNSWIGRQLANPLARTAMGVGSGVSYYETGNPTLAIISGIAATAGGGAKMLANRNAQSNMNRFVQSVTGAPARRDPVDLYAPLTRGIGAARQEDEGD